MLSITTTLFLLVPIHSRLILRQFRVLRTFSTLPIAKQPVWVQRRKHDGRPQLVRLLRADPHPRSSRPRSRQPSEPDQRVGQDPHSLPGEALPERRGSRLREVHHRRREVGLWRTGLSRSERTFETYFCFFFFWVVPLGLTSYT